MVFARANFHNSPDKKKAQTIMALMPCPECDSEISDQAENCPKCGAPQMNSQKKAETVGGAVGGAVGLGCLVVLALLIFLFFDFLAIF